MAVYGVWELSGTDAGTRVAVVLPAFDRTNSTFQVLVTVRRMNRQPAPREWYGRTLAHLFWSKPTVKPYWQGSQVLLS